MHKLRLTFASDGYDRVSALATGAVRPAGIDLVVLSQAVEETFSRMLKNREYDVAEMSLASYVVTAAREDPPFIAIPVFPSRVFRHSSIFVSAKSGIREPGDLKGKRVGMAEYQMTAPVWVRGVLADEYGVPVESMHYHTGGVEQAGREEKIALNLPPAIRVRNVGPAKTLAAMLADGEIDAFFAARPPSTFTTRPQDVHRLFPNFVEVEREYYRRTRIFPIMHTVVIRRELYRQHPWVATSLYRAFVEAQARTYRDLSLPESHAFKAMLPWLNAHIEETRRDMGDDWWPYGLEANRHVLDTFLRYHHEQALSNRRLKVEELFAPETMASVHV